MKNSPALSWHDGDADIDETGTYRYRLWRRWAPRNNGLGHVVFVMLNPSTADRTEDDATIRRCIGFAKRWGHGGLEVVNLFAYRATDPKHLYAEWQKDPEHVEGDPHNLDTVVDVCSKNGQIVLAWGGQGDVYSVRATIVETQLRRLGRPLFHFAGLTKSGQPPHPLRLPAALPLVEWR